MNILHQILKRFNVLCVRFDSPEEFRLILARCRYGKIETIVESSKGITDLVTVKKIIKDYPLFIAVTGYGVISKKEETSKELLDKITKQESGFLWNKYGDEILFVRTLQIQPITELLNKKEIISINNYCILSEDDTEFIDKAAEIAGNFYDEQLNIRTLLRPSIMGSVLGTLLAKRSRLIVLIIILLLLVAKTLLSKSVIENYEVSLANIELHQKTEGLNKDKNKQRENFISENTHKIPYDFSWLCDRIAIPLPLDVKLTSLSIQQPIKKIEENKNLHLDLNKVEINGKAVKSEEISLYMTGLERLGFSKNIKLTHIQKDYESDSFLFNITIDL